METCSVCAKQKANMVWTNYGAVCSPDCFDSVCIDIMGACGIDFLDDKVYAFTFYNQYACEKQTFIVKAKNKHIARQKFWEKYPKEKFEDSIETLYEQTFYID